MHLAVMRKINWWHVEFGGRERESLLCAFDSKSFTIGSYTQKLEDSLAKSLGVPYVVVTNSGTSALTMALLTLGVGQGDQVLVPNITWIATAQAAAMIGADVILVDTLPDLPVMDLIDLQRKITSKTKAILPVHMNGRDANISELKKIAENHGIYLVEDACKAMFSRNRSKSGENYLGTLGDMGCFSMGMISLVPACFGGFVVTHKREFHDRLKVIRWHGVSQNQGEEYTCLASNFKYSDLLASLALSHLHSRDQKIGRLISIYQRYQEGLKGLSFIEMIPVDVEAGEIPLLIDVRSPIRGKICAYLREQGVETCNFHLPLHHAPYLKGNGVFHNSTAMAAESFHLPCGPDQSIENVDCCLDLLYKYQDNE